MENSTENSFIIEEDMHIKYNFFYWIFSVIITLTNIPVLAVVLKKKRFVRNVLKIQIISLSMIDLSAGIAMFGFSLLATSAGDINADLCMVGMLAPSIANDASNLHILVICIIRCHILFRTRQHGSSMVSKAFQITIFVCTWISVFVFQIPKFIAIFNSEAKIRCSPKLIVGANFHSVCRFVVPLQLIEYILTVAIYTVMTLYVFVSKKQQNLKEEKSLSKRTTVPKVTSKENECDGLERVNKGDVECYKSESSSYQKCYVLRNNYSVKNSQKYKMKGLRTHKRTSPHTQSLKTIGMIIFLNSVFIAPFLLISSIECWSGTALTNVDIKLLLRHIGLLNSAMNPFIYGFLMKDIRDCLSELARMCMGSMKKDHVGELDAND